MEDVLRTKRTPDEDWASFRSCSVSDGTHLVWRGTVDDRGRPLFKCEGITWDARRLAWCHENGPVLKGQGVEQVCGYKGVCVDPGHLRPKVRVRLEPA